MHLVNYFRTLPSRTQLCHLRHQVQRFVILFEGRTGSTYLQETLDWHPEIVCVAEGLPPLKESGVETQSQWARAVLTPPFVGTNRAIGFKTKLKDVLDPKRFALLLTERQCRVILMQRQNIVKAIVSEINARRLWETTGDWNLYNEKNRPPPPRIELEDFQTRLENRREREGRLRNYVDSLSLPTLELTYEDLLIDAEETFSRVFSFLGVKPAPILGKSGVRKATSDDLRIAIANFDELQSHYVGTGYEAMFDEVLIPVESEGVKGRS